MILRPQNHGGVFYDAKWSYNTWENLLGSILGPWNGLNIIMDHLLEFTAVYSPTHRILNVLVLKQSHVIPSYFTSLGVKFGQHLTWF